MGGRIRLGFLEESVGIGGAEINVLNLLRYLDCNVFDTVVICPREGPFSAEVRLLGHDVALVPRRRLFSTSFFFKDRKITNPLAVAANLATFIPSAFNLSAFLIKEKIDILHTNSMLAHFYGGLASKIAGRRCLWHVQDIVDEKQAFGLMLKSINFAGALLPDRIVVTSETMKSMFSIGARRRCKVIYNGVDLSKFKPSIREMTIRKEFGISADAIVVGMVGRLVPWKGHQKFLLAAKNIIEKDRYTRFLIVGDTSFGDKSYLNKLKRLAFELGIAEAVIFSGFRKDIPEVLSAMDIFVHASTLPEPFGLGIVEAMAMEKPVVATKGGGVPEIVIDGVTGILVPMGDAKAIENAVLRLASNTELMAAMGKAGRERVEKRFSIESFVRGMSRAYLEALGKN